MVTLVNKFTVHGDTGEFERVWKESSEFMKAQPGFLGFKLHRSLSRPDVYINIARWATAEDHRRVLVGPEFGVHIQELAAVATADPDLYTVVLEGVPAA